MRHVSNWLRLVAVSALAIAGSVTAVAGPAAAGDPPPQISRETLRVVCVVLGGGYAETRESHSCDLREREIRCRDDRCGYASLLEEPPLRDECYYAGGSFGRVDPWRYVCELHEGVLTADCGDEWDWWSDQPMSYCAVEFRPHAERVGVR